MSFMPRSSNIVAYESIPYAFISRLGMPESIAPRWSCRTRDDIVVRYLGEEGEDGGVGRRSSRKC